MRVITRLRGYKQAAAFLRDASTVSLLQVSKAKLLVALFLFVSAHSLQTARENFPAFPFLSSVHNPYNVVVYS